MKEREALQQIKEILDKRLAEINKQKEIEEKVAWNYILNEQLAEKIGDKVLESLKTINNNLSK